MFPLYVLISVISHWMFRATDPGDENSPYRMDSHNSAVNLHTPVWTLHVSCLAIIHILATLILSGPR